jgi:hypothetical protein
MNYEDNFEDLFKELHAYIKDFDFMIFESITHASSEPFCREELEKTEMALETLRTLINQKLCLKLTSVHVALKNLKEDNHE